MYDNSWIAIGTLMVALHGCSNRHEDVLVSPEINRSSCSQEAVQLIKSVRCFTQPIDYSANFVILETGRFVYRCSEHSGWVAIMYPRPGEKVDCSFRSVNQQCPTAWVKDELVTRSFD